MSLNIVDAIAQIKRNVAHYLSDEAIHAACRAEKYCWRQRELGPAKTIQAFLLQPTNLRHIKITMGLDVLRCRTVAGVLKELQIYALVYNLVRLVMLKAAEREPAILPQVSFVDALRWLTQAVVRRAPLHLLCNPHRPQRQEPRVRKRRPKEYPVMKRPRCQLRKELYEKRLTH